MKRSKRSHIRQHMGTSDKFLIGFVLSLTGACTSLYWLVGAFKAGSTALPLVFLFLITCGLFGSAYIMGRSWQVLAQDEKEIFARKEQQKQQSNRM